MSSDAGAEWLVGGGELGALVRSRDWSTTPLGPRDRWPPSLRTLVSVVLECRQPMCLLWGADWLLLYNDEYRAIAGARHPSALGRPLRDVWAEVWSQIAAIQVAVMERGEACRIEDQAFVFHRGDAPEEVSITLTVTPARLADGAIGGALMMLEETTGRVRSTRSLLDSEAMLRAAFANAAVGLAITDPDGRFVEANPVYCRLVDYDLPALRAMRFIDRVHPDHRAVHLARTAELLAGTIPSFQMESKHVRRDGRAVWVRRSVSLIRDAHGEPLRILAFIEDIGAERAAQEEAQAALRERQDWLRGQREALEAEVNGAPLATSLGVLVRTATEAMGPDARAAFYRADAGSELHHVVGMPADYAAAVAGLQRGPESLACGLATYTGQPVLTVDVAADPRWEPWRGLAARFEYRGCWSFPVHTSEGKLVGSLAMYFRQPREATARDLELAALLAETGAIIMSRHTEAEARAQAEARLRASEQMLAEAERVGRIGSWELDLKTGAVRWSRQAYANFGVDPETFVPSLEALRSFVHPDDRERADQALGELRATGAPVAIELRIVTRGGATRALRTQGAITRFDPDGTPRVMTGIVQDITEEQRAAETARLYEASKERLLDLEALERLHEIGAQFLRDDHPYAILEAILDAAISITGAEFGHIQVFDEKRSELRIIVHRGLPAWWIEHWDRAGRGRGACGTALERRARVLVEDVTRSPVFADPAVLEVQLAAGIRAVQSTPLLGRSGAPLGMLSTHYRSPTRPSPHALRLLDLLARQAGDILEQQRMHAALRESEVKARGILMNSADAIIAIDEALRILEWNHGAERIFGYTRPEAIGMSLDRLLPERFRQAHREQVARFARGEPESRAMDHRDARGLRKSGEEFPIAATISSLEVGSDRIVTVSVRDATEDRRRELEQQVLAEVGGALATLEPGEVLERVTGMVTRILADFGVLLLVEADDRLRRLRGASRDPDQAWIADLLMKLPAEPRPTHPVWRAVLERSPMIADLDEAAYEEMAQSPDHLRALRAAAPRSTLVAPLLYGERCMGVLGLAAAARRFDQRDLELVMEVGRRIALFLQNAQLHEAERRAIRLRDEVLGVVAHDLRAPLNSVVLYAQLLRRTAQQQDGAALQPVEAIERASARMNRIIEDLLDVTQLEAGKLVLEKSELSAAQLVREAVEAQEASAHSRSLAVRVEVAEDLWISGDRDRLLQILQNLIANAIKFTPAGTICAGARRSGGEALLWIADTGIGIEREHLPHLFDRFWRAPARQSAGGAGLGLSIVKTLVEAHSGRLWVESEPGQGSTFFFTVPLARAMTAAAAPDAAATLA